jgi:hypothetical protein
MIRTLQSESSRHIRASLLLTSKRLKSVLQGLCQRGIVLDSLAWRESYFS